MPTVGSGAAWTTPKFGVTSSQEIEGEERGRISAELVIGFKARILQIAAMRSAMSERAIHQYGRKDDWISGLPTPRGV